MSGYVIIYLNSKASHTSEAVTLTDMWMQSADII